jgi:hypothetical protein
MCLTRPAERLARLLLLAQARPSPRTNTLPSDILWCLLLVSGAEKYAISRRNYAHTIILTIVVVAIYVSFAQA